MLERVRLIQGIGKFDHAVAANIDFSPLTLVYAENARGKTTLVSIFRSLVDGDPLPIAERRRLGSARAAQVVLIFSDDADAVIFENGAWNKTKPNIAIFDEQFINDNVYSGMVVQSPHREGLHGLIVGSEGVALLRSLQAEVNAVEEHNQKLRTLNSLDEHRAFATVSEIRRLAAEVKQAIVLSHNRPLVCHLWETPGQLGRTAIEVARAGDGSAIRVWDVSTHGVTEHDKRHAKLRQYLDSNSDNPREVAEALRPTIEAFLRVAYPEHYPPGTLLGPFRHICSQHVGAPTEILNQEDVEELGVLTEYANRFHHDTNPAWQTADINDAELLAFVRRTVDFTKRR